MNSQADKTETSILPKLADGFTYGTELDPSEIVAGDTLSHPGNRARGKIDGIVQKANPRTLVFTTSYMGHDMTLKTDRSHMDGGYVLRGNLVHPIKDKERAEEAASA